MHLPTRPRFEWRLRSRSLTLGERTLVMAIVNVTPDSFSGDGLLRAAATLPGPAGPARVGSAERHLREPGPGGTATPAAALLKVAVARAVAAVDEGADIVDLGAESTRPGAAPLNTQAEQARLLPVLEGLLQARPQAIVSVDTYHAETARAAASAGAEIVNDVSGLTWDDAMAATVARSGCGLVLMHTRGRPGEWAAQPPLAPDAVLPTVFHGLCEGLALAEAAGIATERIVADPGFGFGKRGAENYALLAGLGRLHELGRPLLAGLSRKSFLGGDVAARLAGTLAANTAAVLAGAHILRVHDVAAARQAVAVADAVLQHGLRAEEQA